MYKLNTFSKLSAATPSPNSKNGQLRSKNNHKAFHTSLLKAFITNKDWLNRAPDMSNQQTVHTIY